MAKFKVPQKDGEITVSVDGAQPKTYKVERGVVTVTEEEHISLFTSIVAGAEPLEDKES